MTNQYLLGFRLRKIGHLWWIIFNNGDADSFTTFRDCDAKAKESERQGFHDEDKG